MIRLLFLLMLLPLSLIGQKNIAYHSLEVSYIGLNALDLVTTYKLIDRGGYEANPLMTSVVENKPLAIGVKSLSTLGFLLGCRAIRKDHPKAAFMLLLAGNIGYALVVNHNYQISVRLKI